MQLIGSVLFALWMTVTMVLFAPLVILAWVLPFQARAGIARFWSHMQMAALRVFCGLKYQVQGRENIPSRAVVVLSKHQSAWETIGLQCILGPQTWVLKRELMWIPLFGWALAAMHGIAIDRRSGQTARQQILDQGQQRLAEGISIIVFPEGTRIPPKTERRFGMGGALLAAESSVPVLPVAHNAGQFWRRNAFMKRRGTIQVVIGPLIDSHDRDPNDINKDAYEWMRTTMARIEQ